MKRVIAVDWSGAKTGAQRKIWLAEVCGGRLKRLESGRNRRELVEHLIDEAARDPDMVVGLDFAFSFPRWFADGLGATWVEDVWDVVARQGEEWLSACRDPFFGKGGSRRPENRELFRRTERRTAEGVSPKSVFQIAGPGAVGEGSIRGMPHLAELRRGGDAEKAGFSIWPFHEPSTPLVLEIYPRLLTGPVNRSDFCERRAHLAAECSPEIGGGLACKAASSEDAFDAAVSAVAMSRHVEQIAALTRSKDPVELIEGAIWWPQDTRAAATISRPAAHPQTDCTFCDISREFLIDELGHALAIRDRLPG